MNKFLAISLAVVASACGGERSPTEPPPTTEQPTEPPPGTAGLIVTFESDTLPLSTLYIHIRAQRQTYQGRMELTLGYCVPPIFFSGPCRYGYRQILDFEEHTFYIPGYGCVLVPYVQVSVVLKAITDPGQPYAARTLDVTSFHVCLLFGING